MVDRDGGDASLQMRCERSGQVEGEVGVGEVRYVFRDLDEAGTVGAVVHAGAANECQRDGLAAEQRGGNQRRLAPSPCTRTS